jgi:putative pyruvate formate lyase activating enzyme
VSDRAESGGRPFALHGGGKFVLPRRDFVPAHVQAFEHGVLQTRVKTALEHLRECRLCPRACGVNRAENEAGVCRIGRHAHVSSAFPHLGEEDCLRGSRGSGTIFFAGCNLKCVFCQNAEISQFEEGQDVSAEDLAALMLRLQTAGCHNINFVTPEHVVPQILEALLPAGEGGLRLPLVYNTGGYDSLKSLRLMDGLVDIYMPDFKFWSEDRSARYLLARDYPAAARQAIAEMHRQVGPLRVDERGVALRGVLVRHLVMPGLLDETREIMRWLAEEVSRDTYVNLMDQYRPAWKVGAEGRYPEINRTLAPREFGEAEDAARAAGLWRFDSRWK